LRAKSPQSRQWQREKSHKLDAARHMYSKVNVTAGVMMGVRLETKPAWLRLAVDDARMVLVVWFNAVQTAARTPDPEHNSHVYVYT
jgi:hypothetical protein